MRGTQTLKQLRVIGALARKSRIVDAAADLGIAQPAVSRHLGTVEKRFRQRLFLRRGRQIVPSALCETLLPRIRTLLSLAVEVETALDGLRGLNERRLRVGYSTHQFVMHVSGGFMDAVRGIKIEARCMASFDLLTQLRAGTLDAAFVNLPGLEFELHMLELRRADLVLMAGPGHPLADESSINLRELSKWLLIQRETSSGNRRALEATAMREGVALRTLLDLGSWESRRAAVEAGIGGGVVMAGEISEASGLCAITIATVAVAAAQHHGGPCGRGV